MIQNQLREGKKKKKEVRKKLDSLHRLPSAPQRSQTASTLPRELRWLPLVVEDEIRHGNLLLLPSCKLEVEGTRNSFQRCWTFEGRRRES